MDLPARNTLVCTVFGLKTTIVPETLDRLKNIIKTRDALSLDWDDLSDYSTVYKLFDRLKVGVAGATAPDSTFFDRRRIQTLGRGSYAGMQKTYF